MQVFTIAPAGLKTLWLVGPIPLLVLVLVCGVLGATPVGARTAQFEVSHEGLRLRGDWYGRLIPASELVVDAARRVDLELSRELAPGRKTMGTGVPGYRSGWFRLRNGDRARLYLTGRRRAVYIPTTAGYSVLISPAEPDAFVAALTSVGRP